MRAVLDPNVLISALLSRGGAPAQFLSRWLSGDYDLVVSPLLLRELARSLGYPKLRKRVTSEEAAEYVALLTERAVLARDPTSSARRAPDPGDDYLVSLAESERAVLVSGDAHLLGLADDYPIFTPRVFLETLETQR